MSLNAVFFMPGPMEMLIVGLVCVMPLVAIVIVLVALRVGKRTSLPPPPPCPKCGGWTVPGTKFCPHCGSPLE